MCVWTKRKREKVGFIESTAMRHRWGGGREVTVTSSTRTHTHGEMRAISNCRDTSVSTLMKIAAIWSPAAGTVAWRKHAWQLSSMARSAC